MADRTHLPGMLGPRVSESDASVLDLFAGVGWSVGMSGLGIADLGIELNGAAAQTRNLHGFPTIVDDVARLNPRDFDGIKGLIASPPCQAFSTAGEGAGHEDPRGQLVWEPLRWATVIRPEWVVLEQVVPVLPVWRVTADALRLVGYDAWVGVLDAADYGVPQNRRRAILIASRVGPASPPAPTHSKEADLFGSQPWVTMAAALRIGHGWVYDSGQNTTTADGVVERYTRSCDRPAGTLTSKTTGQWVLRRGDERRKAKFVDACVLQGFPRGFQFAGNVTERNLQLGNAVPPPLAAAIVTPLLERRAIAA